MECVITMHSPIIMVYGIRPNLDDTTKACSKILRLKCIIKCEDTHKVNTYMVVTLL